MIIEKPKTKFIDLNNINNRLMQLIAQPNASQEPPCPNCPLKNSYQECTPNCPEAPRGLSAEPDRYPIELHAVPLVFELTALRLFQTCWSCEGHMNNEGHLWKTPQVSFYCPSAIYPKLLLDHLNTLNMNKKLSYPWQITMSDFGQTCGITYTLEPRLNPGTKPRLGSLQQDMHTVANQLGQELKNAARRLMMDIKLEK